MNLEIFQGLFGLVWVLVGLAATPVYLRAVKKRWGEIRRDNVFWAGICLFAGPLGFVIARHERRGY